MRLCRHELQATVSMQFAKGQTLSHLLLDIFTYWRLALHSREER